MRDVQDTPHNESRPRRIFAGYTNLPNGRKLDASRQISETVSRKSDSDDTVARDLLGPDQSKKIFTSRYKLHLPTEAELATELKREIRSLQ